LPILPSLTACGIVLIIVSIIGLYGSFKHDQVGLFFYMILSFCLFIVQFAIAASCLAVNTQKEENFAEDDWGRSSEELKKEIEIDFHCTGFNATTENSCLPKIVDKINSTFKLSGSIGIVFSFTEVTEVQH
jgi:tetraspanin-13/31